MDAMLERWYVGRKRGRVVRLWTRSRHGMMREPCCRMAGREIWKRMYRCLETTKLRPRCCLMYMPSTSRRQHALRRISSEMESWSELQCGFRVPGQVVARGTVTGAVGFYAFLYVICGTAQASYHRPTLNLVELLVILLCIQHPSLAASYKD
mgnify:CR=1 FL=1